MTLEYLLKMGKCCRESLASESSQLEHHDGASSEEAREEDVSPVTKDLMFT